MNVGILVGWQRDFSVRCPIDCIVVNDYQISRRSL